MNGSKRKRRGNSGGTPKRSRFPRRCFGEWRKTKIQQLSSKTLLENANF
ncbi:MAG: hypothetical protein F6K36_18770 [Symploca sp. SIO3C6]|nr:hypothetical protein [Symploca sp. SIO3C6]